MKAVILAGGRGTRISEETHLRPKPMVEIGGRPLLWHAVQHSVSVHCGIGLVAVAERAAADAVLAAFRSAGERPFVIGSLVQSGGGEPQVRFSGQLQ